VLFILNYSHQNGAKLLKTVIILFPNPKRIRPKPHFPLTFHTFPDILDVSLRAHLSDLNLWENQ